MRKQKRKLDEQFLSNLPQSESSAIREFLKEGKVFGAKNLESILAQISTIFSEKSYGIQEAILQRTGFRYPSKIRRQRFCGEEAFKNYLCARALGLPAIYCAMHDFKQRGMAHDAVLVPEKNRLWMLDWEQVVPVHLSRYTISTEQTTELISSQYNFLANRVVFERVARFQPFSAVRELLEQTQLLERRTSDYGECDIYLEYKKHRKALEITEVVTDFALEIPFYRRRQFQRNGENFEYKEERGIARKRRGASIEELPCFYRNNGTCAPLRFFNFLNEQEQASLLVGVLYHFFRSEQQKSFLLSTRERREGLHILSNTECAVPQRKFYDLLREKYFQREAEHYLDALCFKFSFEYEHQNELRTKVAQQLGLKNEGEIEKAYRKTQHALLSIYETQEQCRALEYLCELI